MDKQVAVAGIGMGNGDWIPEIQRKLLRKAELVIGAGRVLACLAAAGLLSEKAERYEGFERERILKRIRETSRRRIVVAVSGDTGFYSAAAYFREPPEGVRVVFYPGVSSLSYLCARLGLGWEDVCVLSLHGRPDNAVYAVKTHRKTFLLTSGDITETAELLTEYGLGDVTLHMGRRLSEPSESIESLPARLVRKERREGPLSVLIENPGAAPTPESIPDTAFIRGEAPMTKEAVRSLCADSFSLPRDAVFYDVGAGSGSVSVALGAKAPRGRVYAFEENAGACSCIEANKRKFGMEHIRTVCGSAPEAFSGIEAPDGVFIGGSGGRLREILEALKQKARGNVRLVMTAVTLETLSEFTRLAKEGGFTRVRIRQVCISEACEAGSYHMLRPESPVFVMTACMEGEGGAETGADGGKGDAEDG